MIGRISSTHGYYNTILRTVIRSATSLVLPGASALTNIIESPPTRDQSLLIEDVKSVADTVNPLSIANKINSSSMLKFMNILAQIGDIALGIEDVDSQFDTVGALSVIDMIKETLPGKRALNPGVLQAKSRLSDGTLSWKQGSPKSMFILPPQLLGVADRFGHNKQSHVMQSLAMGGAAVVGEINNVRGDVVASSQNSLTNSNKRIKAELVKELEDYLEQDYMPFYFHDLRTNEIVSFHAFLESVSDGYDVQYNESEGFGRVDAVQVYKSTKRSVSLSFKLVSTGDEDFDQMWFKVNKLVTLVYPQWSKGRQVSFGQNRFTQPFSQVPSASPLVRLRLGDLLKTNYSKFAVARLFGISNDASDFNLERMNQTSTSEQSTFTSQQRVVDRIVELQTRMVAGNWQDGDYAFLLPNANPTSGLTAVGERYLSDPQPNPVTRSIPRIPVRPGANNRTTPEGELLIHYDTSVIVRQATLTDDPSHVLVGVVNPRDGQSGTFKVPKTKLRKDDVFVVREARRTVPGDQSARPAEDTTTTQAVDAFLNERQNPIFKAFASTKGRGLAGFIRSLKFDLAQSTWNTESFSCRAPKMMKVDIEFIPVHDLPPGIDHNGFNTAPVYNIGRTMAPFGYDEQQTFETQAASFGASRKQLGNINR